MSKRRRNKPYRPRAPRIPITAPLRNEIALHLHAAIATLCSNQATIDSFDVAAGAFNMIAFTIRDDKRFDAEKPVLNAGAVALDSVGKRLQRQLDPVDDKHITDAEMHAIRAAAAIVDDILPRLDAGKMFISDHLGVAASRAMREHDSAA